MVAKPRMSFAHRGLIWWRWTAQREFQKGIYRNLQSLALVCLQKRKSEKDGYVQHRSLFLEFKNVLWLDSRICTMIVGLRIYVITGVGRIASFSSSFKLASDSGGVPDQEWRTLDSEFSPCVVSYMNSVINYGPLLLDLIAIVNPLIMNWKNNEGVPNALEIDVSLTSFKYW